MKISKKIYILMLIALTFIISCDNDDELYPQLGDDPRNISERLVDNIFDKYL